MVSSFIQGSVLSLIGDGQGKEREGGVIWHKLLSCSAFIIEIWSVPSFVTSTVISFCVFDFAPSLYRLSLCFPPYSCTLYAAVDFNSSLVFSLQVFSYAGFLLSPKFCTPMAAWTFLRRLSDCCLVRVWLHSSFFSLTSVLPFHRNSSPLYWCIFSSALESAVSFLFVGFICFVSFFSIGMLSSSLWWILVSIWLCCVLVSLLFNFNLYPLFYSCIPLLDTTLWGNFAILWS